MGKMLHVAALCIIILLGLGCVPTAGPATPSDAEQVKIAYAIDGDTVELDDGRRVRYVGINTPERDQPFYQEATEANRRLVEGRTARMVIDIQPTDRFGRTLAYLWIQDRFVNLELVRQGYANAYTEPPNVRYSKEILAAEKEARKAQVGFWALAEAPVKIREINYDASGPDHENPNGEWVVLENQGREAIALSGFTLKDEANHIYTFPSINLEPDARLKLYTGQGRDAHNTLYWGLSETAVWNNDGDSAYLRNPQGKLVDYYTY